MSQSITAEEMTRIVNEVERAVECKNMQSVLHHFHKDCVLAFSFATLKGHEGVRRWGAWVHENMKEVRYETVSILADNGKLFEEFNVHGLLRTGRKVCSRQGKLVTFEDSLIRKQRLFFDRVDFIGAMSASPAIQSVVQMILKKTMERLEKAQ